MVGHDHEHRLKEGGTLRGGVHAGIGALRSRGTTGDGGPFVGHE
jgi:hypothetical protein